MSSTLRDQVREFFSASTRSYSYNIFKNVYIWFGILWGLPIPLASILLQVPFIESQQAGNIATTILLSPIQWGALAHPFIFGILFGILGSVRQHKDEEVRKLINELRLMSIVDPLTGLSNRRYFTHQFEDELARIQRKNSPLALIFLDLDHFKIVNDTHGHRIGDEILKLTASHLQSSCRPYDIPARWGGEEFIILLPGSNEQMAYLFAERIRQNFTRKLSSTAPLTVTVSIGVTEYQPGDTLEMFIDRADKALYHAKASGRNKVVCWNALSLNSTEENPASDLVNGT